MYELQFQDYQITGELNKRNYSLSSTAFGLMGFEEEWPATDPLVT